MMGLRRMCARTKMWVCSRLAPDWERERKTKMPLKKAATSPPHTSHSCVLNIARTKYRSGGPGCQVLRSHYKTHSCSLSACSSGCTGLPPCLLIPPSQHAKNNHIALRWKIKVISICTRRTGCHLSAAVKECYHRVTFRFVLLPAEWLREPNCNPTVTWGRSATSAGM